MPATAARRCWRPDDATPDSRDDHGDDAPVRDARRGLRRGVRLHPLVRLQRGPRLQAPGSTLDRGLQGRRSRCRCELEAGAAARRPAARRMVDGVRRRAAGCAGRAGRPGQPGPARGRGALPPGAGHRRPVARRALPVCHGLAVDHAQPLALGHAGRHHRRAHRHQPLGRHRLELGSRRLGQAVGDGRREPRQRAGQRRRPRERAPVGAGRARAGLLQPARAGRAAPPVRRGHRRVPARPGTHAQPLRRRRRRARRCGAGRDAARQHPRAGGGPGRAARAA